MDWNLWKSFQELIFAALLYLKSMTGDWGMAIILLTVAIRVILLPLTWKQTKSMVELQRIQPVNLEHGESLPTEESDRGGNEAAKAEPPQH